MARRKSGVSSNRKRKRRNLKTRFAHWFTERTSSTASPPVDSDSDWSASDSEVLGSAHQGPPPTKTLQKKHSSKRPTSARDAKNIAESIRKRKEAHQRHQQDSTDTESTEDDSDSDTVTMAATTKEHTTIKKDTLEKLKADLREQTHKAKTNSKEIKTMEKKIEQLERDLQNEKVRSKELENSLSLANTELAALLKRKGGKSKSIKDDRRHEQKKDIVDLIPGILKKVVFRNVKFSTTPHDAALACEKVHEALIQDGKKLDEAPISLTKEDFTEIYCNLVLEHLSHRRQYVQTRTWKYLKGESASRA